MRFINVLLTYLGLHSQVHNDLTAPIKISAIRPLNKGYIAYFPLRIRNTAIILLPV